MMGCRAYCYMCTCKEAGRCVAQQQAAQLRGGEGGGEGAPHLEALHFSLYGLARITQRRFVFDVGAGDPAGVVRAGAEWGERVGTKGADSGTVYMGSGEGGGSLLSPGVTRTFRYCCSSNSCQWIPMLGCAVACTGGWM